MSKRSDDRKNIVIVGGGYAGSGLARTLSSKLDASKYNLIMITSKPYFVHLVAGIRMTVTDEGKLEDRGLIPYDKIFINDNGTHIVGTVEGIEEREPGKGGFLLLKNGERIQYDILVLATGSRWKGHLDFPDSDTEIREFIKQWRKRFADAKDVVLVGGGSVAIETAGEIKYYYPDTKITIVHGSDMLLNKTYPDKFRKDMERRVRLTGTEIVFNDYIDEIPSLGQVGVKTRNGKTFPNADLVIATTGGTPNTTFISSLDSNVLTPRGNVKVAPTLEVIGHPGVFALGDIIEWDEQKQAGKAPYHSAVVIDNIFNYLSGQPYKEYKGTFEGVFIPIGPLGGGGWIDILWGISVGNCIVRFTKSKDLFVSGLRSRLGFTD
ncbi:FAD/NAD(P)-binding domain superfamily protein [Abortiporus biennis]